MIGTFYNGIVNHDITCKNVVEDKGKWYFDISGLLQHRKLLTNGDKVEYDYRYGKFWII